MWIEHDAASCIGATYHFVFGVAAIRLLDVVDAQRHPPTRYTSRSVEWVIHSPSRRAGVSAALGGITAQ